MTEVSEGLEYLLVAFPSLMNTLIYMLAVHRMSGTFGLPQPRQPLSNTPDNIDLRVTTPTVLHYSAYATLLFVLFYFIFYPPADGEK